MAHMSSSFLARRLQHLPPTALISIGIGYLALNIGCTFLMGVSVLFGLMGIVVLNLFIFLFLQPRWAIPLYLLIAGPSIATPVSSTGIFSRLFAGNLIFASLVCVGLIRLFLKSHQQKSLVPMSVLAPHVAIVLIGFCSIAYARTQPDAGVRYAFTNSNVSLLIINLMEMVLLLGLPILLLIVPTLIRSFPDVRLIIRILVCLGTLYAIGTIFAKPLGLSSELVILGNQRPQVFGLASSVLGLLLVFFACVALGQALYAQEKTKIHFWWCMTAVFCIAVIMTFGRTAWLTMCTAGVIMISLRARSLAVVPVLLALILLMFIPGVSDYFNPDKVYGADRLLMWQDAVAIWQRHPLFGVGAGNYQFFNLAYGLDVGGVAHNQYLETLAEMGIQGLLCLLWSIFAVGHFSLQRFQSATTPQGKAIALSYLGYFTGLIFFGFFGSSFLPSVAGAGGTSALIISSYNWLLLALVLTIPQWEISLNMHT